MENNIVDAIYLSFIGIFFVFIFLIFLIFSSKLLAKIIDNFAKKDKGNVKDSLIQLESILPQINNLKITAMSVAIHLHRKK